MIMESKTNIALGIRYKDKRTKLIYTAKEFICGFKKVRCENPQKITVIFAVDIMELYFIQI